MKSGLEILELNTTRPDFVLARVALHGRLAIPFEIPKPTFFESFHTDEEREGFLARQAKALLDAYGDAREQRQSPDSQFLV